jgi:arginyl-tRNA synthetase
VFANRLFEAAHVAGFVPPGKEARHVPFGLVLGEDGKKLKSRSGDTVLLSSLLQESVDHAEQVIRSKLIDRDGGDLEATVLRDRAGLLGVAAVKYADLSMHRESNYRYSPSKMMSLTGNTAPYILYALVRIRCVPRMGSLHREIISDCVSVVVYY